MGTAEILIVFSALMALISVVTIGIDWIGKPLKHRRFIPRIYRFEDEKLPVDQYGHIDFRARTPQALVRAASPPQTTLPAAAAPRAVVARRVQPAPRAVARVAASTAFSDNLDQRSDSQPSAPAARRSAIAGTAAAGPGPVAASSTRQWQPGMAIDLSIDGRKPTLAAKAERYWINTFGSFDARTESHFDDDDLSRMAAGKAPRRINPRTGKPEAMELTGLRRASNHTDVRMHWPDDSVDPWAAS